MDTYPIPARSLERYLKIDGRTLEKNYKEHLSGFRQWDQLRHAGDWVLIPENIGENLCIDESMHAKDLFTFVSNKEGHGKRGTLIAVVRGTRADDVVRVLKKIPERQRKEVKEVTMDYSDSMHAIVERAFPQAAITIDVFHVIKNQCDALDELRMRFKRKAIRETARERHEFNKRRKQRKKAREYYRRKHPKKRGEKRGRPRKRANEKFKPSVLSNGDTRVELFTRARHILPKSGEKWSERQKARAELLFGQTPRLKEAYSLVCRLRSIFKNKKLTKEAAREKLRAWYRLVADSRIKELIAAKDTIKAKENDVLNYFVNHATNAAAESLNSKLKGFRSELRGVRDLPFFMYRCCMIFG